MQFNVYSSDINYSDFLNQFERLGPNHYLKVESNIDEGYCFNLTAKQNKNLNNEQILKITEQALAHLVRDKAFEDREAFAQRQLNVNRLAQSLQTYGARLKLSAPWYWKILAWLGFQRPIDKQVDQLFSCLSEERESQIPLPELLERNCRNDLMNSHNYLRFFYHFVLGSTYLKVDKLEGGNPASFQYYYHTLLREFQTTLTPGSPSYQAIQGIMMQLHIGFRTIITQACELPQNAFMQHLNSFLSDPSQKTFMIPGGNSTHLVLYEIEKEDNGTFTLRLIDTGVIAGNFYLIQNDTLLNMSSLSKTGVARRMIAESPFINQKIHQCQELIELEIKNKTQDLHYIGLTAAHFSESFIQTLFAFKPSESSMDEIVEFLNQQLATPNKSNLIASGRKHARQTKGVCAQKTVASWLHMRLGNELYQQFKTFYTVREIETLERLFEEQSTSIEEALATCTFTRLEENLHEEEADTVVESESTSKQQVFDSEPPLSEEERAHLATNIEKYKEWFELIKSVGSHRHVSETVQHWTPQEAKEEIRQLAHQVLRNRQQKLERLLAAQAA